MNDPEFDYRVSKLEKDIADAEQEIEAARHRIAVQVDAELFAARVRKAQAARQPYQATDNALANETARQGILAMADSEDRLAAECDRRAEEAGEALKRAPSDLRSYYSAKQSEHRRKAAEHRENAKAHRAAAAGL